MSTKTKWEGVASLRDTEEGCLSVYPYDGLCKPLLAGKGVGWGSSSIV